MIMIGRFNDLSLELYGADYLDPYVSINTYTANVENKEISYQCGRWDLTF